MPVEEKKYFRYRREYTSDEYKHPEFERMRDLDEAMLNQNLPRDCYYLSLGFRIMNSYGNLECHYFENEDDMMAWKAIYFKDKSIYTNFRKARQEQNELIEYGRRQRKDG